MKPSVLPTLLLLSVTGLAAVAPPSSPSSSPSPSNGAPSVMQQGDFMQKVRQAMTIGDRGEIARLVKSRQREAIDSIRAICEAIAGRPTDKLEAEIDALRKGWKDAHKTGFVDITYEYFSLLRPEFKVQWRKQNAKYRIAYKKFVEAEKTKDGEALKVVGVEFLGFGKSFEELGDSFMASQAWSHYAICFGEHLRGEDADLKRECEGWGKVVETRGEVELKDAHWIQSKERFETLEHKGFGDPTKGPAARETEKAEKEAESAFTIDLTYEIFRDIEAVRRPQYTADSVYQMWGSVGLKEADSKGGFATMQDRSPTVIRTGAAKAHLDMNGDGEGDVEIPITGNTEMIEITLGEGDEARKWAFLAKIARDRDTYQGFDFNLGPSKEQMSIYVAPASSLVGMVGETPIRIIDDNMDGNYGSVPLEWGYVGLIEGSYQRDMDSIVLGDSKVARPWSELQKIGEQWYRCEAALGGKQVSMTPTDVGDTGKIKVDFKGGKLDWLVIHGKIDKTEKSYFNLLEDKAGIEVPVGSYELYAGQLSKGKRAQMMKALLLPTDDTRTWSVSAGETTTIELGAPFGFDFIVEQNDDTLQVNGKSVVVVGKSKETYQRLWNCVVAPEVHVRKAGSKRGSKEGKLRPAQSQEEVTDANDYNAAWFPALGKPITKKKKGEEMEASLLLKKNKLFGKIQSDWKK